MAGGCRSIGGAWLLALAMSAQVGAERLPAVMLRRQPLLTPVEAAGTGLAPTVGVRVTVAADGRVAAVDVLSVSPSTDLDELFAEVVRSTVSRWRFAPALDGGEAVASELSWSLEFRPAEANPEDIWRPLSSRPSAPGAHMADDLGLRHLISDAPTGQQRQLKIFTLPIEQQRAHLERLAEEAEAQIDSQRRRSASGDGFAVVTDHDDEGAAETVRRNVIAVFQLVARVLGNKIPFGNSGVPVVVYMYRSESQYRSFVAAVDGIEETTGLFCAPGLIALHSERSSRELLLATLIHEAVHAFIYRHVVTPGRQLPRWLDEGFADYFGNSRVTKKGLVPGDRRVTQFYTSRAGIWRGRTSAQLDLDVVKQKIRRGEAISVPDILNASRETFYGDTMSLYYAQSWIMVHMLRHGEAAWTAERFPDMMLLVAEGYPASQVVEKVYGLNAVELEARFRDYSRSF